MNLCGIRSPPPPCFSIEVKVFWRGGKSVKNGFYGNHLTKVNARGRGDVIDKNSRFRTTKVTYLKFSKYVTFVDYRSTKLGFAKIDVVEEGVWSPRTAKTAAHLFCHGCDEVIDQTFGNTVPLLKKCNLKSRTVAGGLGRAAMRRRSMSQTCSIGFRSGEHAGNSIRCIVSASSMFSTRRALCGRALSSWKTKESPMAQRKG
ncbi:hypothetical protein TNCV_4597731 [Trichonephila clavipes]|nr:hypothetical protein TNCV_4597731 [Trichonephila clavipes]